MELISGELYTSTTVASSLHKLFLKLNSITHVLSILKQLGNRIEFKKYFLNLRFF